MPYVIVTPNAVSDRFPETAVAGTVMTKDVAVGVVTVALIAPIRTTFPVVVVANPVPEIVIRAPIAAVVSDTPLTVGVATTVTLVALTRVMPATFTEILPVTAPAGTTTVREVAVAAVTVPGVAVPVKVTTLLPGVVEKFVPVNTTEPPIAIVAGENDVSVGAATIVKAEALVTVPKAVVTLTVPVVAPVGTVTVIDVDVAAVTTPAVAVPVKTTVLPVVEATKLVPVITTDPPTAAVVGAIDEIVGVAVTVKVAAALVAFGETPLLNTARYCFPLSAVVGVNA